MVEVVYRKKRRVLNVESSKIVKDETVKEVEIEQKPQTQSITETPIKRKEPGIQPTPKEIRKIRQKKNKMAKHWMRNTWPDIFGKDQEENPKPLTVGIHKQLYQKYSDCGGFEVLGFSPKPIRGFMHRWVNSPSYLNNIIEHAKRYDLNGESSQTVTAQQEAYAKNTLKSQNSQVTEQIE